MHTIICLDVTWSKGISSR